MNKIEIPQCVKNQIKERQDRMDKISEILGIKVGNIFVITIEQLDKANELIKSHEIEKHKGKQPYAGAIGGAYAWTFSQTGLGQTQGIRCICGDYLCLTDFSDW